MQLEKFAVNKVSFEYSAYVGISMEFSKKSSGYSGIAPYGFHSLNSLEAQLFINICKDILQNSDISSNQRCIISQCYEECEKVINENSVEYWKKKWFEENQRAEKLQDDYYKEVGNLRSDLLYLEDKLQKAQKKIIYLKRK